MTNSQVSGANFVPTDSHEKNFHQRLSDAGLVCNDSIIGDGKIHRFKITGKKDKPAWYVLHILGDGLSYGAFGCWHTDIGVKGKWCSRTGSNLTTADKKLIAQKQKQIEQELSEVRARAKKRAQFIWERGKEILQTHSYLERKCIKPYGLRLNRNLLIVPLKNAEGELSSLQFIRSTREKKFLRDGITKSCFHTIGEITDKIYIAEGFATASTIHEATACAVFTAFYASNLLSVAQIVQKKYSNHERIICADNDAFTQAGNIGVQKATEAARLTKSKLVIPKFQNSSSKPTDFNDLMCLEGLDIVRQQLEKAEYINSASIPQGYYADETGIYYQILDKDGMPVAPLFLCSPLEIAARTRDAQGLNHGRLLIFKDSDRKEHQWSIPMDMLAGDGTEYRKNLLNMGVNVSANRKAREKLTNLFLESNPNETALCVTRTGWYQNVFVLPDKAFGRIGNERILFQSASFDVSGFNVKGTLEEWRDNIGKYCVDNSRLIFAVSLAFAAPLLYLLNEESGGFHFKGASSTGKTTALKLACSVWGEPARLQHWRATSNGLEGVSALHNDSLLCLDEMGQVDPKEAGEIAYMLANGAGKNRSKKDGELRKRSSWRLLFLSSGEIGLTEHVLQIGKKTKAGQQVRLLDVPVDAGAELGIFENLHGMENGADFARFLDQQTKSFYGAPIREFLEKMTQEGSEKIIAELKTLRSEFVDLLDVDEADGQVKRAAWRFSLVAAAGFLTADWGITGWQKADVICVIERCFRDWITERGGYGSQEELNAFSQVRKFFQTHSQSRFANWDFPDEKITNRAGFYKKLAGGIEFFVETEIFRKEICLGIDSAQTAKACMKKGWLIPDTSGKTTCSPRLPDTNKTRRIYHFNDKVLGDESEKEM